MNPLADPSAPVAAPPVDAAPALNMVHNAVAHATQDTESALRGLDHLRAAARAQAHTLAAPNRHDEAWRFTNIAALLDAPVKAPNQPPVLTLADIAPWVIPEATQRIVFVDGVHAPQLGSPAHPGMAVLTTLRQALHRQPSTVMQHLAQHAHFEQDRFTAQNTAALPDAAVVLAPGALPAPQTLHLLFVATQDHVTTHPRTLVIAEAGSALTVLEDYVARTGGAYFTNSVTEIAVGSNAQLTHVRLQRESLQAFHIARCALTQARDSRYHGISIALGAEISRLDFSSELRGTGVQCTLDGLAHIAAEQLADTHTRVAHAAPHGISRQTHKCVVADNAHAVFNGRVQVLPGAQKTDSAQSSRTLLLGPKAQVNTLPQLEIEADDVRCTHGATVGQLNADEVFYLQSRGLSSAHARSLLTYAFAADIVARIPLESVRQQLQETLLHTAPPTP